MSITLKEYWIALQKSLSEFDKKNTVSPKDEADKDSYRKQRTFLETITKLGLELEEAPLLLKKGLGTTLEALPEKVFGSDKIVTTFSGPLSLTFAELVYLPHVKRFNNVSLDDQNIVIRAMVDLEQKKAETNKLAKKLEKIIKRYKTSDLGVLNLFSSLNKPSSEEEKKGTVKPAL